MDGAESSRLSELAAQHPSQWVRAASLDEAAARERMPITQDFNVTAGKLYHQRRRLADGELLFFANSSADTAAAAEIEVDGASITRFDAMTGETAAYPSRAANGRVAFNVELPPAGSLLVVTSQSAAKAAPAEPRSERGIAAAGPVTVSRTTPNVLRIDYCDLKLGGKLEEDLWVHQAMEKAYQHHGFARNPWWGTQYKTEFLDKDKFPPDSGFEAVFHFDVEGAPSKGLQAVVERPRYWKVSVNGVELSAKPGEWWLDVSFGVYDIGAYVRPGANTITLRAQPMSVHAEIQPVYVLGDFGVAAQQKGFRIAPARALSHGSWKEQALPFYSDAVSYRQTFEVTGGAAKRKVRLGKWLGVVAEVRVNGKHAGVAGWAPFEVDVTKLLRPGKNEVEVLVYGSLKNLLGPHHGKFNPGLIGSWLWRTAPEHMPAGDQYQLIGYGLFEEFALIEGGR